MNGIGSIRAVQRHIRANTARAAVSKSTTYQGDGTASLSDSYRALWTDMVKQGLPPQTTRLLH